MESFLLLLILFAILGGFKDLMAYLNSELDGEGNPYSSYIVACFTVPILAFKSVYVPDLPLQLKVDSNIKENPITYNVGTRPSSLNGYTPKNKKLLTYPYCYLAFNPSTSSSKVYRFEDFTSGTASFEGMSECNPNPQVALIPKNYKGLTENTQETAFLGGYPTVSSKVDNFNVWLASSQNMLQINAEKENLSYSQTKANQQLGIIGALGTMLGGADSAGNQSATAIGGNIISGMVQAGQTSVSAISNEKSHELNIREQMAQVEAQSLVPDNASLTGSNATLLGYQKISQHLFATYTIKAEFARKIDKFFDMFGYQTNELKVPNINNRPNWNYIKTLNCNINANIPQTDLAEIKELFNSGITLWHSTSNFKNYYANNR